MSPDDVVALATVTGWPVLADPRSGARVPSPAVVTAFDCILRCDAFADRMLPDLVVQIGSPPASRVLSEWVARAADSGAHHVVIDPHGRWLDPGRRAAHVWGGDPNRICRQLATGRHPREVDGRWIESWQRAEATAVAVVERVLATEKPTSEPAVARALVEGLPDGAHLVVSSSMPVRDVEWYSPARGGLRVHANRGANGIDGVVSTAVGVALASGAPTAALVGDLAYLHDLGALVGATGRNADLTVVVVDNDGGGIFSFLPQASELDPARFEQLFGTPHGLDLAAVTAALGVAVVAVEATDDVAGLGRRVAGGGIGVAVVTTDRKANVDVHDRLQREVRSSLEAAGLL